MSEALKPLSRLVDADSIPAAGTDYAVTASPAECEAVAKAFGIVEVRALSAQTGLSRTKGKVVQVEGRLQATVVQNCVVSLVPVEQVIDEEFSVRLAPARDEPDRPAARGHGEILVDLDASDPPDTYDGRRIDLGSVVLEQLALALDPYPRAPGAELALDAAEAEPTGSDSPFAALAALRTGRSK